MLGRAKIFCAIAIAALVVAGIGALPASAGTACLAAVNTTSQPFSFSVEGWSQSTTWTWRPNEETNYVSFNGVDIKSPNSDNSFTIHGALGTRVSKDNTKFDWHPEMTGSRGHEGTCAGTWVMTIMYPEGVAPAPVPPSGGGMNYEHPGSCLYVKNTRNFPITLTLVHPTGYENLHWDYSSGNWSLVAINGSPLTTPDGGWSVNTSNGIQGTWSYEPSYTRQGCNGEWVFTL